MSGWTERDTRTGRDRERVEAALAIARRVLAGETEFTRAELRTLAFITVAIYDKRGRRVGKHARETRRNTKHNGGGGSDSL